MHPDALFTPSYLMRHSVETWVARLAAGCSASVAIVRAQRTMDSFTSCMVMSSDACKEKGVEGAGIGGFLAGFWWTRALGPRFMALDIPELELLALAVNFIVFEDICKPFITKDDNLVVALVDAQAAAQIVPKGVARSPMMQRIMHEMQKEPAYSALADALAMGHLRGESNYPADCASRGKLRELREYCVQTCVNSEERQLPQRALNLIETVLQRQEELSA